MLTKDERYPSGCSIAGFINKDGRRESGKRITDCIENMHERSNGLGGGFAAYGIYPEYKEHYALHLFFNDRQAQRNTEDYLHRHADIYKSEFIPTRRVDQIINPPILWRYFVVPHRPKKEGISEEEYLSETIIHINTKIDGAFVASSGKNMGVFKAVGYPEDVARFYDLEQYEGYMWTAHGRFPTNTPGWWGGAHPFGLLDWTVVHNGEISSYGANYRYLESKGYPCMLMTDTEVILYAWDYLVRRHKLPYEIAAGVLAAPFWHELDGMADDEHEVLGSARIVYESLLLNGPFSILVTRTGTLIGLTDRIKLRPMVAAEKGDTLYIATEEAALRVICPQPEHIWTPGASELVIGRLKEGVVA